MVALGVVLINYNSEKETVACVKSLLSSNISGMHVTIIIVDNDSSEESTLYLKNHLPVVDNPFVLELIENVTNDGFSGGNNVGIHRALVLGCEAVIVLNNDTIVEKNMLMELVSAAKRNENAGIIVPKIYFEKGHEFHKEKYMEKETGHVIWYAGGTIDWKNVLGKHRGVDEVDTGQYDKEEAVEFATGCCMYLTRGVIERVGIFDERYFLYFEDADLSMRVKKTGYTIRYIPQAYLWHKNAGSTGGSGSGLQDYYMTRNRLLFGFTYAPIRVKVALSRLSFQLLRSGRTWEKVGVRDYYKKRFGKGSYTV